MIMTQDIIDAEGIDTSSSRFSQLNSIIESIPADSHSTESSVRIHGISVDDDHYTTDEDYESDDSDYYGDDKLTAQEQWEESLKQINALVSFVVFPLIGKVLGRRFSHAIWKRVADWWYI